MTRSTGRLRSRLASVLLLSAAFLTPADAAPQDEIRATFERFVVAQNDHDMAKLKPLLLASPNFLWITRGMPIWGSEAALTRFATLYEGTWRLEPDTAALKIVMIGQDAAQLFVPIIFTIGAAGQPAQTTRFLMNQVLVRRAVAGVFPASDRSQRLRDRREVAPTLLGTSPPDAYMADHVRSRASLIRCQRNPAGLLDPTAATDPEYRAELERRAD